IPAADHGFDDAVIAVRPAVENRDPLVLGVDEDVERVAQLLHPGECVLLEHRLDVEPLHLDDARVATGLGGAVGDAPQDRLLLRRPGAEPRLGLVVDGASLEPVDDDVDAGLVGLLRGVAAQCSPIDDEADVDDVRLVAAAMVLDGQLDDRVAAVIEDTLEALEPLLGVAPDPVWDIDVLALDDRPHQDLRGCTRRTYATVAAPGMCRPLRREYPCPDCHRRKRPGSGADMRPRTAIAGPEAVPAPN